MIKCIKNSVLIFIFVGLIHSCETFICHIKPIKSDQCPTNKQPCLTLSEFAANHCNNTNITLIMLPGNHSLTTTVSLSNFQSFEMYSLNFSATIICESSSYFSFELVQHVSIRRMDFVGCGNNLVRNVLILFIEETTFNGQIDTGTSLLLINTTAEIYHCSFIGNQFGTVVNSVESLELIVINLAWLIVRNVTGSLRVGGALISMHSNISISHSSFENNTAEIGGDMYAKEDSNISIFNSTFIGDGPQPHSTESPFGGAIFSHQNTFSITECRFHKKHATVGASIAMSSSNTTINSSQFDCNSASDHAAGLFSYNSTILVFQSSFHENVALAGTAITSNKDIITLTGSVFTFNRAYRHAGALDIGTDTAIISGCHFESNFADSFAGAVLLWHSACRMYGKAVLEELEQFCDGSCDQEVVDLPESSFGSKTQFISNSAPTGATMHVMKSTLDACGPILFSNNSATLDSNVHFLNSEGNFKGLVELVQNFGSFFAFDSNISFSGCTRFVNCSLPKNTTVNFNEGGALTLYQTMLGLQGEARFEYNCAENGGGILAAESEIYVSNNVYILNNRASTSGGGLYLSQSKLLLLQESSLTISKNNANKKGGGIHAVSSSVNNIVTGSQYIDSTGKIIEEYKGAILTITKNTAQKGGGIYLKANSKVTVLKDYIFNTDMKQYAVNFIGNSAQYGGAIYVDDATNSGSCISNPFEASSPKSECFINVVATQTIVTTNTNFSLNNILYYSNIATLSGATLFGGLLDRCIVSPFNEVDQTIDRTINNILTYKGDGLQYFMDISTISENEARSISSYPVQICPCVNDRQSCNYPKTYSYIKVVKGITFNMSLIAVDQVYRPVNATIQGHLDSARSNLLMGKMTQIRNECTNVTFQIISPNLSEELTLFASDGPCKDAKLSILKVGVTFLPCVCPIGFIPSTAFNGVFCMCVCASQIGPYVTECNSTTQTFKRAVNIWISYFNSSNSSGYLIYKYCPFDYCILPNTSISTPINLNQPNGVDSQCALNRTGMLCGACKSGLSLSLGSSKCLKCPSYWPAQFVTITVFAILAGIGLVVIALWLNITVAVGTLNGLLFYANILAANKVALLPYPEPNFITVFISWLNLELGIDVCYIEGMDTYIKTWLQLAFPMYIILLVLLLIIISRHSSRLSELIAKRNPVAALAILILISYGKLFHVVLLAQPFSHAVLTYPDNTKKILWLPDGTISYLNGKHIVLFIVALLILAFCIAYSFLLLCWQLALHLSDWKILKCIKSPTLNLFMEAYHAPYAAKHRYWTGLLLLARAVIYLLATINVSGDPQNQLISIIFILSCVILLKMFVSTNIFKKWLIDSLESFFYFNIIFLASFTAYNLSTGNNQDGIAYTSVILSIIATISILFYHLYEYTALFLWLRNSKLVTYWENRFTPKSKQKENEDSHNSNTDFSNSDCRHDFDTMDILISDTANHKTFTTPYTVTIESGQQPTKSVVEIN